MPYLILTIYARLFSTMRAFFDRDPIVVLGILFDLTIYFFQCLFRLLSIRCHFYLNFYIPFLFALLVYFLFGLLLNPLIIWTFKTIFLLFPFPSLWFYLFLFVSFLLEFGFWIFHPFFSFDRSLILDFFQIFIEMF